MSSTAYFSLSFEGVLLFIFILLQTNILLWFTIYAKFFLILVEEVGKQEIYSSATKEWPLKALIKNKN
jgi:hypothetical protein